MRRLHRAALAGLAVVLLLSGCAGGGEDLSHLRIMVPNAPGSGYDATARTVAKAFEDSQTVRGVEVFNLPGSGGTVGLQRLIYEEGNGQLLMLMGQGMVGAQYEYSSAATLQDTTPIARLIEEPEIVVVSKGSPYRSLAELVADWRAAPGDISVGGGSTQGGPDHLAPMLIADAIGIRPRDVTYVQHDGGGVLLAAILDERVSFGISGVGEYADQIRSGQLRALAVTSETRVPGFSDVPTLREAGVDVVYANWRGIVAPPGLGPDEVHKVQEAITKLHDSAEWRDALARNGWTDAYLVGEEFGAYIQAENATLGSILADLGLTRVE
ncbi:MAG TPA: tripartite tricarboxylate transporter substrate binding protein [Jiangellaceae bacterium]